MHNSEILVTSGILEEDDDDVISLKDTMDLLASNDHGIDALHKGHTLTNGIYVYFSFTLNAIMDTINANKTAVLWETLTLTF